MPEKQEEVMVKGKPLSHYTGLDKGKFEETLWELTPLEKMVVTKARCDAQDPAACEAYYFAVRSEEPGRPGLRYRWEKDGNAVAGEILVRLGELDPDEFERKTGLRVEPIIKKEEKKE